MSTGTLINGRPFYVERNNKYGMWFNGKYGAAAAWILGRMTDLIRGRVTYSKATSTNDTPCPSSSKLWQELWNGEFVYSETAIVECVTGNN